MSEIASPESSGEPTLSALCYADGDSSDLTDLTIVAKDEFDSWYETLDAAGQAAVNQAQFKGGPGQTLWLNNGVIAGGSGADDFSALGSLALQLPEGNYRPTQTLTPLQQLGWALGGYQFTRYKAPRRSPARLILTGSEAEQAQVCLTADAVALTRDLINTGAGDMAPSHMSAEASALAEQFGAQCSITTGDELLDMECGAIHAVGRAAEDPPCLIDIAWSGSQAPADAIKVAVVGKGVTFDSGGLDIKPAAGMRLMKKDMGGGAAALGLAYMIMAADLPVHLRVLVPCAENAISGNAFRPGDVLHTHKGLTVEIDNTDAEGRLLLCDALSIACEDEPDYIFDFATLTGSARSAVGAEIAAMFCNDDALANELMQAGEASADSLWRLPLHSGYRYMLDSKVADLVNSAASGYGGAITAALYLENFVENTRWTHFDLMAYNTRKRPGHPEGGEAMAIRAVFHWLANQ